MIYLSEKINGKLVKTEALPEFAADFDLIVCGLGTAGSFAALFSAEKGLSVLGIETFSCLGGNHAVGGINCHYFGNAGGLYEEIDKEIEAFARKHTKNGTESRKLLTEQSLIKNGAEILYEATVCGVWLDGKKIIGLRVLKNGKITDFGAKVVMDCTAEAVVAHFAGCETEFGRASDGQTQPYTLVSLVKSGDGYFHTNIDFGRVDPNDTEKLSEAVLFARSYKMKEEHADKVIIAQMPILGLREGRRILPEEQVSIHDLFADKATSTPMFYAYADLDKHGWDIAFDSEELCDWAIGANLGAYNVTVAVPYKAILPRGFEGILVPCRALGVDRDVSSCVRMNLDMKKAAEAAAVWTELAVKGDKTLREVDYADIKARLEASGCLKESDNRGVRVDGYVNPDGSRFGSRDVNWITDPEALPEKLKTDTPGEAIWSAKRMGEKAVPVLRECLSSEEENLRKHAAFALSFAGSGLGISVLREMVAERDGFMLRDCRKNNNLRGCMAIYYLGRLADREIVDELIDLICDPDERNKAVYGAGDGQTIRYQVLNFNNRYFQFMSGAVAALIRIREAHPDLREKINSGFERAFSTDDYYDRITTRPKNSAEGNMVQTMRKIAIGR